MAYNSTIDKATDDILIYGNTAKDGSGTSYVPIVDSDGQLQVDVLSNALPTGASTSAKQDTVIGHLDGVEGLLTTIDGDTGNISTKIDTIAGAVSGTEVQVDVLTMPTTTVQATNLDIRDIDAATDDITIHGDVGVVDQLDLTNSNPLVTAVVDANGDQITSFGGGTQYTEADTDASITGTAMMMEGAGNALVPAQGTTTDGLLVNLGSNNDVTVTSGTITTITNPVTVTATNLDVQSGGADLATSAQGSAIQTAVELIDDTVKVLGTDTYTEATSKGVVMGAVRRDADTTLANTTNEFAPLQVDANGYLKVEIFDGGGSHTVDDGGSTLTIDVASGGIASGAIASGAIASGAIASGAIAAGAIAAGATSIATTEDTASAGGDHLVKVAQIRLDTPVSGANVSASGDYTQFIADNFGKLWVAGTVPEDVAHIAGESITRSGVRRIDTPASSAGSSGDWATMDASAEGAIWSTLTPTTTGGASIHKTDALVATAVAVKASAGNIYGYHIYNPNSSDIYIHVYNIAQGSVTVGTSSRTISMVVPALGVLDAVFPMPLGFSTAITVAATTTLTGNTAPGTGLVTNIYYK